MFRISRSLLVGLVALFLAACGGSDEIQDVLYDGQPMTTSQGQYVYWSTEHNFFFYYRGESEGEKLGDGDAVFDHRGREYVISGDKINPVNNSSESATANNDTVAVDYENLTVVVPGNISDLLTKIPGAMVVECANHDMVSLQAQNAASLADIFTSGAVVEYHVQDTRSATDPSVGKHAGFWRCIFFPHPISLHKHELLSFLNDSAVSASRGSRIDFYAELDRSSAVERFGK